MENQNHHDWLKLAIAWIAGMVGSLTLSEWVLALTLVYTVVNIVTALRREVRADRLLKYQLGKAERRAGWPPVPEDATKSELDWSVEDIRRWERDHGA